MNSLVSFLDFVNRNLLLTQMFSALGQYLGTLASTAVLWLLMMYMFGAIAFAWFAPDFNDNCQTKLQCVLYIMTVGLLSGGGIGS